MRASGLVLLAFFSASTYCEENGFKSSSGKMSSSSSSSSSSISSQSSSAMMKSASGGMAASSASYSGDKTVDNRLHTAHEEYHGCQYTGEWGDCDPFKMIRIKEERLVR